LLFYKGHLQGHDLEVDAIEAEASLKVEVARLEVTKRVRVITGIKARASLRRRSVIVDQREMESRIVVVVVPLVTSSVLKTKIYSLLTLLNHVATLLVLVTEAVLVTDKLPA